VLGALAAESRAAEAEAIADSLAEHGIPHVIAEQNRELVEELRRRQVPLAVVMVSLTTLTLWSLGQAIIVAPEDGASGQVPAVARL